MKETIKNVLKIHGDLGSNIGSETARDIIATEILAKLEYDNCVVCGDFSGYKKAEHVDNRQFYIEGAGQMCSSCYAEIYGG